MKFDCADRVLTALFYKFGVCVAKNPSYFIIIPLALSAFLLTGMQRLVYEDDPEYLFSPVDGLGKNERSVVEKYYPLNYSGEFNAGRLTRPGKFGRVIVTPKDSTSVLTSAVFEDLVRLNEIVESIEITYDEDTYKYKNLCAKWKDQCYHNDVLDLHNYPWGTDYNLSFPMEFHMFDYKRLYLPSMFGGVKLSESRTHMLDAAAVTLYWFLEAGTPKEQRKGVLWEAEFLKRVQNVDLPNLNIARFVSDTIEKELEKNAFGVIPYFIISVSTMLLFTYVALSMSDCVKSKPLLGCMGVFSAMIGTGGAFGLLSYLGLEFITINMAAPFLMLGIGMDDTFVMLASWRKTKLQDPVEERMGRMFSDAAVSITITSLTDMLSFWIGVATPFPCVRIFCIYTALSVFFTFVYHVTFFAGCMALVGRLEAKNKHGALLCVTATPKSQATERSSCYRFFCTGGLNPRDPSNPEDNKEHVLMLFFKNGVGKFLSLPPMKILVLCLFVAYLGVALWSCTKVKEGLQLRKLSQDGSYSIDFYDVEDRFFREYCYRIQVIIDEPLQYSNPKIRTDVEKLIESFEASEYIASTNMTESWLREYERVQETMYYQETNSTDEQEYIDMLRAMFLDSPVGEYFRNDVKLSKNFTEISSTRYVIQSYRVWNTIIEKEMLAEMRRIAKTSKFKVTTYHQYFIFMDQYLLIRSVTIQAVSIAAVVMTIISLIFIPNPLCALWVGFSIISIEVGVVGYMVLWDVYLDGISMINLIMCIGFSVDFSAHVSYAFLSSKQEEPNARMRDALYSLGLPIVQGAISTLLSVAFLLFSPSYIFITFFKTVFLVIVFGAIHGLFLLPVMLSLIGPGSCSRATKVKSAQQIVVSITGGKSDEHFNQSVNAITIPRPKTNSRGVKTVPNEFTNNNFKDSIQDSDRDPGLGTSAEESSDVSAEKGSETYDDQFDLKDEPIYNIIEKNHELPEAFQHVYDNDGYSSSEEVIVPHVRKFSQSASQDDRHVSSKINGSNSTDDQRTKAWPVETTSKSNFFESS